MSELNKFEINQRTPGFESTEIEKFVNGFNEWRKSMKSSGKWDQLLERERGDLEGINPLDLGQQDQKIFKEVFILNHAKEVKASGADDDLFKKSTSQASEMRFRHFLLHALHTNPNILN